MNREDIIRMAQEAKATEIGHEHPAFHFYLEDLEHFADLVASAERERLSTKFMKMHEAQKHNNNYWHFAARKIWEEV